MADIFSSIRKIACDKRLQKKKAAKRGKKTCSKEVISEVATVEVPSHHEKSKKTS
jgi:hypothetical protein